MFFKGDESGKNGHYQIVKFKNQKYLEYDEKN